MFTTPQKQNEPSSRSGSPKKVPLNGFFSDGVWHCNCSPRLPASHFLVRKEGPNKGRWFYTCQGTKEVGCGFFLWDDNAVKREMLAVMNNSRSEPSRIGIMGEPLETREELRTTEGLAEVSNNGIASIDPENEEQLRERLLSPGSEMEAVAVAGGRTTFTEPYPESPQRSSNNIQFTTPVSKRKRGGRDWSTPLTAAKNDDDVFNKPSSTGQQGGMFGLRSPSKTPTPSRFRDSSAINIEHNTQGYDITENVMELLKGQHIDEVTTSRVKQLLNKNALKTSGIARGRDITRVALKAKDATIAELQQKITSLEVEREMDKLIIRNLKK